MNAQEVKAEIEKVNKMLEAQLGPNERHDTGQTHWGVSLSYNEPTTGVYSRHDLAGWAFDSMEPICEGCELGDSEDTDSEDTDSEDTDSEDTEYNPCEFCEPTDYRIGDWQTVGQGDGYRYDSGEWAGYYDSNMNVVQVIYSRTIRYGRMCSPCYPGQVDAQEDDPTCPDAVHIQAYYAIPECDLVKAELGE